MPCLLVRLVSDSGNVDIPAAELLSSCVPFLPHRVFLAPVMLQLA